MKYLFILAFIIIHTNIYSQEPYNYVLCENVRIYKGRLENYQTTCSFNEKDLKQVFGKPDTIIINDQPTKYEWVYYGRDSFIVALSDESTEGFRFRTDQFRLVLQDSIEIKVGTSIEKLLRYFPKSALNQKQAENGVNKFLLYHLYNRSELEDIKICPSRLIISYLTINKEIVLIERIDFD